MIFLRLFRKEKNKISNIKPCMVLWVVNPLWAVLSFSSKKKIKLSIGRVINLGI